MKKLLIGSAAAAMLAMTASAMMPAPAGAQVYLGGDRDGVGVRIGPRARDDCRIVRERTVTPGGRVIMRTREICD